ncbi:MAG: hypothetical protein M3328_09040 [Chloroflexota bacterium]|nr:hypothetical protein [Chloroflexota bacterium]
MANASTNRDQNSVATILGQAANRPSPLNRRPVARRLVTIFRGSSSTGKTHLALSMAEAGIGRICVFDTEFKTRNVPGVNERFDAIESDPDTLLEDIQWAIDEKAPDGSPAYGGLVLDSWNGYFDTLYGRAIELAEQQRGEGAKLTTSEVELLQTKAKKVLDLLTRQSRRWVAITEHATPQGQELDENEAGQLIIMTIGGTDYYSDVTFDLSLVLGSDFRAQHTATVSKTNVSHLYPLGRKMVDLTYEKLVREVTAQEPIKQFEPATLPAQEQPAEPESTVMTPDDLLAIAEEYGIAEVHMSKAAARYCNGKRLDQLNASEIEFLYNRLVESRGPAASEDATARSNRSDRRSPAQESHGRTGQEAGDADAAIEYAGQPETGELAVAVSRSNGRVRG